LIFKNKNTPINWRGIKLNKKFHVEMPRGGSI
jgi:hypothetical protein